MFKQMACTNIWINLLLEGSNVLYCQASNAFFSLNFYLSDEVINTWKKQDCQRNVKVLSLAVS